MKESKKSWNVKMQRSGYLLTARAADCPAVSEKESRIQNFAW